MNRHLDGLTAARRHKQPKPRYITLRTADELAGLPMKAKCQWNAIRSNCGFMPLHSSRAIGGLRSTDDSLLCRGGIPASWPYYFSLADHGYYRWLA
ncbi:hypothetical protein HAX54_028898, partial [Datura stramonium]|nr:hypothetical protein [Datura stramonium]